jgi:hypothetical protein
MGWSTFVLHGEVGDGARLDVDAHGLVAERVLLSELGDNGDGAGAGFLCERVGDDLDGVVEGPDADLLLARQRLCVLAEAHLRRIGCLISYVKLFLISARYYELHD